MRHELPYKRGITEDIYHDFLTSLGRHDVAPQKLFMALDKDDQHDDVFYDYTDVYAVYDNNYLFSYTDDNDRSLAYKIFTLYSLKRNRPISFYIQFGSISDNVYIANALNFIDVVRIKNIYVTDIIFTDQENLDLYAKNNIDYLAKVPSNIDWINDIVEDSIHDLLSINSIIEIYNEHNYIHSVTKTAWHNFKLTRKYYAKENNKSSIETIKRRVYVHIFLSNECNYIESEKFKYTIFGLKGCIELDEDITKTQEEFIDKYFNIKNTRSGIIVTINNDEYAKTKKEKVYS